MSILPGSEGRRDPYRADAARRERVRFARDIGDEAGQAWAHEPRRAPRKFTVGTFLVLVAFGVGGAVPLLLHDGDGGLLEPDCTTPAVEVGPSRLLVGESFAWQAAGPERGPYVVALDAEAVTGAPDGQVRTSGGRLLSGPTDLPGCRSRQTVLAAPDVGRHQVTLFRHTGGRWEQAAVALLQVT